MASSLPLFDGRPSGPAPRPDPTRNRHKGNARSVEAWELKHATEESDCVNIERHIFNAGPRGLTSFDLEQILKKPKHKFSGRLTTLKDENKVREIGKRDRCGVLIHKAYLGGGSQ
jgi:hypothetical protein